MLVSAVLWTCGYRLQLIFALYVAVFLLLNVFRVRYSYLRVHVSPYTLQ